MLRAGEQIKELVVEEESEDAYKPRSRLGERAGTRVSSRGMLRWEENVSNNDGQRRHGA